VPERLRVLVAGWINSPHVVAWVESLATAGHDVELVGRPAPELTPLEVPTKVHTLPASGPPLLRSLRMSRALADVAGTVKPDLVHAHWLPEFGWMAAREKLAPLVCSAWGSDVFGVRGLARRRTKLALKASNLVFADSLALARATRDLADGGVPVEVVRWGLDLRAFSPGDAAEARARFGIEHSGPLVASVRGFKSIYNHELLFEAFALLRERMPDVHLLFKFPSGDVPQAARDLLDRLGLADSVTLLGSLPPEQLPDVYRAADVVVSIASSDSSPRSVWEALACGRSVVVSDLPWARDELTDGLNAVLTPLDSAAIADSVERAILDRGLGAEGRALAEVELDPLKAVGRIEVLYRAAVEARP
jgi:L-malate glycosyltransferase